MMPDEIRCKQLVEMITDYMEGALDPHVHRLFEAHLAECEGCTAYVEQMRRTIGVLGRLSAESVAPAERETLLRLFRTWVD